MYSMWPLGRSSGGPQSTTSKETVGKKNPFVLWIGGVLMESHVALCWPHFPLHGAWQE